MRERDVNVQVHVCLKQYILTCNKLHVYVHVKFVFYCVVGRVSKKNG